jgi:hypothetical protein
MTARRTDVQNDVAPSHLSVAAVPIAAFKHQHREAGFIVVFGHRRCRRME